MKRKKVHIKRIAPQIHKGEEQKTSFAKRGEEHTQPIPEGGGNIEEASGKRGRKTFEPSGEGGRKILMDGWEDRFDYSDMRGLFFIIKGHCGRELPSALVMLNGELREINVGSYDPEVAIEHYCVYDCVTFHCIYGGGDLDRALKCVEKRIVACKNNPENYFREVSEVTNEDFYARHYLGEPPWTDAEFKKNAIGKCWKMSDKMKAHIYGVKNFYAIKYADLVDGAYARAEKTLSRHRENHRSMTRKARRKLHIK